MRYLIFAILLGSWNASNAFASPPPALKDQLKASIPQFAQIDANVYRGGQPSVKGMALLKELGIRTIINFRHERDEVQEERKLAEQFGLHYVHIPWRIQWHPGRKVMQEFLAVLKDQEGPFFMHCRRGAERTGVADAIYRRYALHMGPEEARQKATEGFDIRWIWRPFVEKRVADFYKDFGG